jgi:hypothetical protein
MKTTIRLMAEILICLTAFIVIGGCYMRPVTEKELVGTYEGLLPDGGMEFLILKPDGAVDQHVSLKDGREYSSNGTWTFDKSRGNVKFRGIYITVNFMGEIDHDIGKVNDTLRILPIKQKLSGKVVIGADDGQNYEKSEQQPKGSGL